MKGATAEPLVRTMSPPKAAMTKKIGSSQNFFRTRMKAQNSRKKLIIDDPQKPQDAHSEIARQNAKDWYGRTAYSRLDSKTTGAIIVVMQRLHEDDLVGYLMQQEGWEVLSLPAIAEVDEVIPIGPVPIDGNTPISEATSSTIDTGPETGPDIAAVAMPEPEVVAVAMPEPEAADFEQDTFQSDLSGIDQAEQQLDQLSDFDG